LLYALYELPFMPFGAFRCSSVALQFYFAIFFYLCALQLTLSILSEYYIVCLWLGILSESLKVKSRKVS